MMGLKISRFNNNESRPFQSHHKIMELTRLDQEVKIDLDKSLQENYNNYRQYFPKDEYWDWISS